MSQLRTRYPGLASFTTAEKDLFFGRKQETRDLANLLSVERTVVLFSASGIGKTSLLQAGVMPLLYGQLMVPVPIRFGTADLLPEQHFSTQLDAAAQRFSGQESQRATDSSARETFWGQIARQPFGQMPAQFTPLFIFDQFEELFTLYPEREKRARFVAELADIIQERLPAALRERILTDLERGQISPEQAAALEKPPPMRFIFSIRSDMLHFMDELSEAIPYILRSRFQLFGLDEKNAREALVEPASLAGAGFASRRFGYTAGAQAEILAVLGKKGEVESFQLQAVCQAIEEKIIRSARQKHDTTELFEKDAAGLPLVAPDFYGGRAGIDAILDESYNRRIESLAETDEAWPARARHILEDVLVNKNDRRQSVDVTSIDAPATLLDELERQRLVRKEARLESFYYEISHDSWLKPMLRSRDERRKLEKRAAERRRRWALVPYYLTGALYLAFAGSEGLDFWFKKSEKAYAVATKKEADAKMDKLINEARTAGDLAKTKKLDAEKAELKAQALLEASKLMAVRKLPKNFDILIPFDSLNCDGWRLGTISSEIGKLKNLKFLGLGINQLTVLPEEIGELKNLTTLYLESNELTALPPQIGKLKNLTMLDLSYNKLTALPVEIGKLKNLTMLDLRGSRLTVLPAEIGELKKLKDFRLQGNPIPESERAKIRALLPSCAIEF